MSLFNNGRFCTLFLSKQTRAARAHQCRTGFCLAAALAALAFSAQAQTNALPVLAPAIAVDPLAAGRLFQRTNDPVAAASRSLNALATMAAEKAGLLSNQPGQIEVRGSTAVASFGPHRASFAANLATPWAVDLSMFDSLRLRADILGIYFHDTASDQIVLLGSLKDNAGEMLPPDQIIYINAFSGIQADVLFKNSALSLEQDIVIRRQLPDPAKYSLNPATTRLVVITEMLTPVEPVTIPTTVDLSAWNQAAGIQGDATLPDQLIIFNTMRLLPGRAFTLGDSTNQIPVGKSWVKTGSGQYLVESTPYPLIKSQVDALPPMTAQLTPSQPQPFKTMLAKLSQRARGSNREQAGKPAVFRVAGNGSPAFAVAGTPGVVLDYLIANTAVLNVLFGAPSTNKIGFAEVGQTTNDVWNGYNLYLSVGAITNLLWSNTNASGAGITVTNATGGWGNGVGDGMYGPYSYASGTNIALGITNLANGTYDFYIYGHGPTTNGNSIFQLKSGTNSYPTKGTTIWGAGWNSTNWEQGQQYVVYKSVPVLTNQPIVLTVSADTPGYAIINGIQIVTSGATTNSVPISSLFNVNFGTYSSNKVGFAAVGLATNDFWTGLYFPNINTYAATNLQWSDGYTSHYGVTVTNAPGDWNNGVTDGMFGAYIYLSTGANINISLTNMANGIYDFYVYGHSPSDSANSIFQLASGTNSYGPKGTTIWGSGWNSTNWEESQQYVVFRGVPVITNQTIVLTVLPDSANYAIINGLQVVLPTPAVDTSSEGDGIPDAWKIANGFNPHDPTVASGDPDGDGLTNLQEYQHGTDPHNPDTDYDGRNDGQEVADGTNPLDPGSYFSVLLGYWRFDNTNTWVGNQGQLPLQATGVQGVSGVMTNAALLDNPTGVALQYRDLETNAFANINCRNGSVRFWFKPDWSSASQGGTGPGSAGRLIEMGNHTPTNGWWAIFLDSGGNNLSFATGTNGSFTTNVSTSISWSSNQWHEVVLTYTPSATKLYIDLQQAASGSGVAYYPNRTERAAGFRIGSDSQGNNQAKGAFDELEAYNWPLSPACINYQFTSQSSANSPMPLNNCPSEYIGNWQVVQLPAIQTSFCSPEAVAAIVGDNATISGSLTESPLYVKAPVYCSSTMQLVGYTEAYLLLGPPTITWSTRLGSPSSGTITPPSPWYGQTVAFSFAGSADGVGVSVSASASTTAQGAAIPSYTANASETIPFAVLRPERLAYWAFNGILTGDNGQAPIQNNVSLAPSPFGQGVLLDSPSDVDLEYPAFQSDSVTPSFFGNPSNAGANGSPNIRRNRGSIRFWFSPDWTSGSGPANGGILLDMLAGGWTLKVTPYGNAIELDAGGTPLFSILINWTAGQWHQVVVTYSPTKTVLYVDGQQLGANGSGIANISCNFSGNFRVGSDGHQIQARGILDELETFNYELLAADVSSAYQAATAIEFFGYSPPGPVIPPVNPNDTTAPVVQLLVPINAR